MKACKFCGTEVENTKRKCPSCGSTDLLHVCENCSEHFEGVYCPKCGVKVGQKGKTCPECQTVYFSNACPNCGYIPTRKSVTQGVKSSIPSAPPPRPTVTEKTATETAGKMIQSPPPANKELPQKKGKKRWLLWLVAIIILVAVFGTSSKKETKVSETASTSSVTTAPAQTGKSTDTSTKTETEETTVNEDNSVNASKTEQVDELIALQAFYDDFSANGTAANLEEMVSKYGLYTDFRSNGVGHDYYKVASSRELAKVISNADLKTAGNYIVVKIYRLGNDEIEEITFHKDQDEQMNTSEIIYELDEKINTYIIHFNQANTDDRITKDLAQTYHHHGRDHSDQVKFSRDGFEVVLTNGYPFKVVIRGERAKTNDEYKAVFFKYAKGYAPEITDETLNSYWTRLLEASSNSDKFDEFSCDVTIYNDVAEMIVLEGEIK